MRNESEGPSSAGVATAAWGFTAAGLAVSVAIALPFVVLAAGVLTGRGFGAGPALYALQIYSAIALSFLAGVSWRAAIGDVRVLRRIVTVLVTAGGGLWLGGSRGLWLLCTGFLLLLMLDFLVVASDVSSSWHGRRRAPLLLTALLSLAAVAYFGPF